MINALAGFLKRFYCLSNNNHVNSILVNLISYRQSKINMHQLIIIKSTRRIKIVHDLIKSKYGNSEKIILRFSLSSNYSNKSREIIILTKKLNVKLLSNKKINQFF